MSGYTPGPWKWRINKCTKRINLFGRGLTVMDFVRYGMNCAAPRFLNNEHLMVRADELSSIIPGEAHHASWNQDINHPDAKLIALAPELIEALEEVLDAIGALSKWHELVGYGIDEKRAKEILDIVVKARGG